MAKEYRVKLLRKEKIAKDTWLFAFEKPEGYVFIPGQYQSVTLTFSNGKKDWRDFTIASNPTENELWVVTKISQVPSEFKKQFLNLSISSEVIVNGGSGGFLVDKKEKHSHVFIAGGIGVTVFRSILTAKEHKDLSVTLIVSFSSKEHSIFEEELREFTRKKNNKQIIYTFTNKKGRISESFFRENLSSILESIFMIAGSQSFVDAIYEMLLKMNVPKENIRIDYFTGY